MLNIQAAKQIVSKALPLAEIQSYIEYKDLYVFQIFTQRPGEEEWDPFYSVNRNTGEFRDFSIITDANPSEIVSLFENAKHK